eukprot:c7678_g1_i1 orf=331-1002(+)
MYSDRIASNAAGSRKRSIKDRLGEGAHNGDEPARENYRKRFQNMDGRWQHDMYDDDDNRFASRSEQISTQDLRSKLKRNVTRGVPSGNDTSSVMKDLREKLSGPVPSPQARTQTVPVPQQRTSATAKATITAVATVSGSKPPTASVKPSGVPKSTVGATQADAMNIVSFLQLLGLSKYLITFQAEEIDMSVLRVMKDGELKELGIPMGPRKKILLALASQSKH